MEITLSKEVYYHGESISATLVVTNNSRKTVKNLKVQNSLLSFQNSMLNTLFDVVFLLSQLFVMQHVELTMVSMQLVNVVASLETREGCPITPGHSFTKEFLLTPLASSNVDKRGIALDGYLKVIFICRLTLRGKKTNTFWQLFVGR